MYLLVRCSECTWGKKRTSRVRIREMMAAINTFVVLGHDLDGNAIGVVIIDTKINPNLPLRRQQMHYQLSAKKYAFLKEKDRFVDCSDLKTITGKRFKELFGNDKAKGIIMQDDLELIKGAVISYEDASPKMLRRFGLLL